MGLTSKLSHCLDDLGHAAAIGGMVVAEPAAIGVDRQLADAGDEVAVRDEPASLSPFSQKPRSSSCSSTVIVKLS